MRAPSRSIYQPRISRDGEWITFLVKADETDSRIYAARFRGTQPIPSTDWIPLTSGDAGDDKPRLTRGSPAVVLHVKADGHRCIWIQQLDPATLRPIGAPVAFQHFHSARRSLGTGPQQSSGDCDRRRSADLQYGGNDREPLAPSARDRPPVGVALLSSRLEFTTWRSRRSQTSRHRRIRHPSSA